MKDLSRKVTFFLKKDNYENSREIWGQYFINTDQSTQVQINTDVILRNIMLGEPREDDSKILMLVVLSKE